MYQLKAIRYHLEPHQALFCKIRINYHTNDALGFGISLAHEWANEKPGSRGR